MTKMPQEITDAELGVLDQLWQQGPANIRQIMKVVYPEGTSSHYATVQKLLERLESKGYVTRNRRSAVHRFTAAVSRDELIGRKLETIVEKLGGGSFTPVLTSLIRSKRLSRAERSSLQRALREAETTTPAHATS